MKRTLVVLLVAGALAPATSAFAADSGGVSIRLGEAPASRRADPRASNYVIDHVKPGTTITRKVIVANKATTPLNVQLYSAAADIKGGEFFPAAGHTTNELSSWTRVSAPAVTLQPGKEQTLEASVAVPSNASSGERYAVIWAEIRSPG